MHVLVVVISEERKVERTKFFLSERPFRAHFRFVASVRRPRMEAPILPSNGPLVGERTLSCPPHALAVEQLPSPTLQTQDIVIIIRAWVELYLRLGIYLWATVTTSGRPRCPASSSVCCQPPIVD